jgi:hypothetical protein
VTIRIQNLAEQVHKVQRSLSTFSELRHLPSETVTGQAMNQKSHSDYMIECFILSVDTDARGKAWTFRHFLRWPLRSFLVDDQTTITLINISHRCKPLDCDGSIAVDNRQGAIMTTKFSI